jgi:D-alanyl-D-alanine carboxypeptidase
MKLLVSLLFFVGQCIFYCAAQKLDDIDRYIKKFISVDSVPGGTLLIVKNGKIVKAGQYGLANLELQVSAKAQTAYELASVSKPITATAIMQLVQAGKLHLDSSLHFYLGEVVSEKYRTVTLRHILSHTSGIPTDHFAYNKLYAPTAIRYTVKEQLTDVFKMKPASPPGQHFLYSNAGYFLQAALIEKVTGQSFQQYLQQQIFEPAGMKQTHFVNNDSIVPNRAQVYSKRKGVMVRFSLETNLQALDANGFAGLISTVGDLQKFATALLEGKLINKQSFALMTTIAQLSNGQNAGNAPGSNMGLGWFIKEISGHKSIVHTGHTGTAMEIFPDKKLTIIFLANRSYGIPMLGDKGYPIEVIIDELAALALKKYGGQ